MYYEILKKESSWNKPYLLRKKEILWNLRRRSFRNGESELQWIKQNPKIHREKQKEKWAKRAREKETLAFTISSAFSLFGRVMKTHYFQRLANYVINSLLLCSPRRDSNKICESKSRKKSWTKARRKVSTQVHRFPKHFSHNSRSFEYFAFFSQQIKHNCFLLKILARFCLQ